MSHSIETIHKALRKGDIEQGIKAATELSIAFKAKAIELDLILLEARTIKNEKLKANETISVESYQATANRISDALNVIMVRLEKKQTLENRNRSKREIIKLIGAQKMPEAFELLDQWISDSDAFTYNNLKNRYINQANNFEIVNYSNQLKVFVSTILA